MALRASADASLRLTTEHLPPYSIVSPDLKQVTGVIADKVFEMMRRAGISYTIAPSGWNRAFTLAQTQSDTCVFGTARLAEREAMFKWIGPLYVSEWQMFGRTEDPASAKSLADIRGDAISVYRNDALDTYLKARGYQVVEAESSEASLSALLAHRSDYWAQGKFSAPRLIAAAGANARVRNLFTFEHFDLDLACNPGVSNDLIDKLRAAMKQMEQDGTMQRIDARYIK
jgi:polar amino acid transport system substrate-binding protein